MYEFLNSTEFLENRKNNKHHVFRNLNLELPTWDEILREFDESVFSKNNFKANNTLKFISMDGHRIKLASDFLHHVHQLDPGRTCSAHCYVALKTSTGTFGRHNDSADVIYWQLQGRTKWIVEDTNITEYEIFTNDAIYIPCKMFHTVTSLTPRAGMSFGIDYHA